MAERALLAIAALAVFVMTPPSTPPGDPKETGSQGRCEKADCGNSTTADIEGRHYCANCDHYCTTETDGSS